MIVMPWLRFNKYIQFLAIRMVHLRVIAPFILKGRQNDKIIPTMHTFISCRPLEWLHSLIQWVMSCISLSLGVLSYPSIFKRQFSCKRRFKELRYKKGSRPEYAWTYPRHKSNIVRRLQLITVLVLNSIPETFSQNRYRQMQQKYSIWQKRQTRSVEATFSQIRNLSDQTTGDILPTGICYNSTYATLFFPLVVSRVTHSMHTNKDGTREVM